MKMWLWKMFANIVKNVCKHKHSHIGKLLSS